MVVHPPIGAITQDLDWHEMTMDCVRAVVKYSVPIKVAATRSICNVIHSARQCAGPGSDMFLRLVAFLVPLVLEFFLAQLAEYAEVEMPEHQEARKQTAQATLWEAEEQRQRWHDHDKKHEQEKKVNSWSLDDGMSDLPF